VEEELATERRLEGYSDGSVAVLEIHWEGTNTGPMETPTGDEMPATGKQARVKACQVFEIEDGRVKHPSSARRARRRSPSTTLVRGRGDRLDWLGSRPWRR
jgi:SnoaL-like polyketide cyclase